MGAKTLCTLRTAFDFCSIQWSILIATFIFIFLFISFCIALYAPFNSIQALQHLQRCFFFSFQFRARFHFVFSHYIAKHVSLRSPSLCLCVCFFFYFHTHLTFTNQFCSMSNEFSVKLKAAISQWKHCVEL